MEDLLTLADLDTGLQQFLFAADTFGNDDGIGQKAQEGEQGAQHQRHGEEEQQGGTIHGVAHDAV